MLRAPRKPPIRCASNARRFSSPSAPTIARPQHPILLNRRAFAVPNILTSKRCDELVALSERVGYAEAPVNMGKTVGEQMRKDIRNNERVQFVNQELANELYQDISTLVPETIDGRFVVGLNEQFRFYKYGVGHRFTRHRDGTINLPDGRRSYYTVLYYLNDEFEGGNTILYDDVDGERKAFPVSPTKASALIFRHSLLHEGEQVRRGVKYVLRSDVFYK